jgi:hypothetical protein
VPPLLLDEHLKVVPPVESRQFVVSHEPLGLAKTLEEVEDAIVVAPGERGTGRNPLDEVRPGVEEIV